MINVDKSNITTVILNAELLMYGYLAIRVSKENEEIVVTWFGMADGGEVVSNQQKKYSGLNWSQFTDKICEIEVPENEDDYLSINWGLQLGNNEDELMYELETGLWDRDIIEQIVNLIEELTSDEEPVEIFRNLFDWA